MSELFKSGKYVFETKDKHQLKYVYAETKQELLTKLANFVLTSGLVTINPINEQIPDLERGITFQKVRQNGSRKFRLSSIV
jgi:hypothetical protein